MSILTIKIWSPSSRFSQTLTISSFLVHRIVCIWIMSVRDGYLPDSNYFEHELLHFYEDTKSLRKTVQVTYSREAIRSCRREAPAGRLNKTCCFFDFVCFIDCAWSCSWHFHRFWVTQCENIGPATLISFWEVFEIGSASFTRWMPGSAFVWRKLSARHTPIDCNVLFHSLLLNWFVLSFWSGRLIESAEFLLFLFWYIYSTLVPSQTELFDCWNRTTGLNCFSC
jgi:hypothetical protein